MNPRHGSRTVACDRATAVRYLAKARGFLAAADGIEHEPDARAVLLVLAGIAASDAICCATLRRRAAGSDHRNAVALLRGIPGSGEGLASDLRVLLGNKHKVSYSDVVIADGEVRAADRAARRLVDAASRALARATTR